MAWDDCREANGAPVRTALRPQQLHGEVWVEVPARPAPALEALRSQPAGERLTVWVVLPGGSPAGSELLDVAGRRLARRELAELGSGRHAVDLGPAAGVPAGVYALRLWHREHALAARAVVLR